MFHVVYPPRSSILHPLSCTPHYNISHHCPPSLTKFPSRSLFPFARINTIRFQRFQRVNILFFNLSITNAAPANERDWKIVAHIFITFHTSWVLSPPAVAHNAPHSSNRHSILTCKRPHWPWSQLQRPAHHQQRRCRS